MSKYENLKSLIKKNNFIEEGGLRTKNIHKSSDIKSPLFSIITVVKNSSKNIRQTIESVIKQADQNIEYIIVDGNSDDETLDIIKNYNEKIDYWCSLKDKGIYDAMNYGLQLSSGSIIGIINSGDLSGSAAISGGTKPGFNQEHGGTWCNKWCAASQSFVAPEARKFMQPMWHVPSSSC